MSSNKDKRREYNRTYNRYVRDNEAAKFYKSKVWRETRGRMILRDIGL